MKNVVSVVLIGGILLFVNLLSNRFFLRFDLTEDKQYTLSSATRNILKDLEDPVTITAYFSEDLEPSIAKIKEDLRDMLTEYSNYSKGFVDYEFINPSDDAQKQDAIQKGVRPVIVNVREKDEARQKQAFIGAILSLGERNDVIPVLQPGIAMEYALSTSIKRLAVVDKPSVGIIQGHGEPTMQDLGGVMQGLSILYNVENIDLTTEASIPERFKAIALLAPKDSIPFDHFIKLDEYLGRGGKLFVGCNRVDGDLQNASGTVVNTGLETWLQSKGVEVEPRFVIDNQSEAVTVQQQQGFFSFNTQVEFPFLPLITNFSDHPITKGLEQVILPFASPVTFLGDSTLTFTPIAFTSGRSGTINAPTYFDINNLPNSFPLQNLTVGAVIQGNFVGDIPSTIIVVGDGDFPITGQQGGVSDNVNLLVNSIDWLSDDTGLIDLRTKGVATRPIEQEYLGEEAEGTRSLIKYLNFGVPILLIIIYGVIRSNRQRNIRLKRSAERYV